MFDLEDFSGVSFREKFNKHIFHKDFLDKDLLEENPYHSSPSDKDLRDSI